ncbi:hypothetical protein G3580_18725 [Nitrogeniibacter mangrovi]|uniref:Uncharacterized protein n=1 Tax=Nitrogeniibacter mangrovi TaxID=2016596 RepID=A0A6C1B9G3_9RHOO|nr:hypothetical protein [Nitrogeniibacter mangrovi]QID19475.1 hypothetical protein G3580_18725 [Nitrogeniibacter mangrovi]
MANEPLIFGQQIDTLSTLVEEGARATAQNVARFIEPAPGTLRRAKSKRHHLIFGRRGSGKSSLLLKAGDELEKANHPIAIVDLEPFKGHHYPDVLLSVLIATLLKYELWLIDHKRGNRFRELAKRLQFWKRKDPVTVATLHQEISKEISALREQLHLADDAGLRTTTAHARNEDWERRSRGKAGVSDDLVAAEIEQEIAARVAANSTMEVVEESKRSKSDYLLRHIIDYQRIFRELSRVSGYSSYLFLDDLYHLKREDQASILDYFHRIAKNNNLWLKIGTIKNRSNWYRHDPQPLGLKIGDDADDINLDLTLEKFSSARGFLLKILNSYANDAEAPKVRDFVADGGVDRLVIASGGVTRDFLGLFRRSIDEARERLTQTPDHARGPKMGAEDVNVAAGSYGETKREEFERDTLEDRARLEQMFEKIKAFCLEKNKANVFLVDQEATDEMHDTIQELVDLRLIHQIRSRVTEKTRTGKVFRALLLDISQYTGERMRRDIEMIEFWRPDNKEILRKAKYIFDPNQTLEEIQISAKADRKKVVEETKTKEFDDQISMDFGD